MSILKEKQYIKEIKSSSYNGYHPPLKTKWQIIFEEGRSEWNKSKMLRLPDYLDFTYYINYPSQNGGSLKLEIQIYRTWSL
ncbi:hypothetical protein [Natronincola ferrireducens]|uniref:hypothetical protein n=1 Tax=Natronincola ferrireducens TaxID=393762 RepID=UPI000B83D8DE|nr:hypothetical protein [Natronincola ferrireducens]